MGSIIGQKIDYNGRGSKRPAAHTQQTLTQVLPPLQGVQTAWSKTLIRRDHSSSKLAPNSILIEHPKTRYDQLHIPIMPK